MPIDRRVLGVFAALPLLTACEHDFAGVGTPKSNFGDANRQTMMAQVINPEPEYDTLVPPSSAHKAAKAAERHATDTVKQPENLSTTEESD